MDEHQGPTPPGDHSHPEPGGSSPRPPLPPAAAPPPSLPDAGSMPPPDDWLHRLLMPAYETKGWLKFLGAASVIVGGINALSIVGILWAWVYVWLGILLWQAGDRADQAHGRHDPFMLEQYLQKLKTVIMIAGVTTAIGVLLAVFGLLIVLSVGWMSFVTAIREMAPY